MSADLHFDFTKILAPGLPPAAAPWSGFPKFIFVGGHNDPSEVPVAELLAAITEALSREGATLATYGLNSGAQGFRPLREFLSEKLHATAGMRCPPEEILMTSGSLQAMDLVNAALLGPGDTAIIEQETYSGAITKLARLGAKAVGIPLDAEGMRADALSAALDDCRRRGERVKLIYTIPTVQNPSGAIMGTARRLEILRLAEAHGAAIFEDDCYADLVWSGERPPAFHALSKTGNVVHIGSFSKSIAPALRVGYIVAPWPLMGHILALKTDAGSGALEQMLLAEFCRGHFSSHLPKLRKALRAKLDTIMDALSEQFGTAAEFSEPQGGIFIWVKLPDHVDTARLAQAALAEGITLNPGPDGSTDKAFSKSRLRLCFALPDHETIRAGVAALADVCRREFGVPARSANVELQRPAKR